MNTKENTEYSTNEKGIMGYIPGAIKKRCFSCNKKYYASEHSVQCKPCAEKANEELDTIFPNQREDRVKEMEEFLSGIVINRTINI
jgi:hypothetical protein